MSTELIDCPREGYQLTGFYGGDSRGYCLQITSDHGYVQVTREGAARLRDGIDSYLNSLPKPHVHAELMALYAEDAKETDEPWERWQERAPLEYPRSIYRYYDEDGYTTCVRHPSWDLRYQYRRKPVKD